MLPSHIYEPLPYGYLLASVTGAAAADYSHASLMFSGMLITAACLIIRMRYTYRRQPRPRARRQR